MTYEKRLASEIAEMYHGRPLAARGEMIPESYRVRVTGDEEEFYLAFTSLTNATAFANEVGAFLVVYTGTQWQAAVDSHQPTEG